MLSLRKTIISLIIIGIILPNLCFGQETSAIKIPTNFEEVKILGQKIFDSTKTVFPEMITKMWKQEVLPVWNKIGEKEWFTNRVKIFKEELRKEKQEMKESFQKEISIIFKSLFNKIKKSIDK